MSTNDEGMRMRENNIAVELRRLAHEVGAGIQRASRSCVGCLYFDERHGEVCTLAKARPPARIIAFGCESWEQDIPF